MKTNKVEVSWTGQMSFEAEVNDHRIVLDADELVGGQNKGPRPKALLLVSLAGCTGMDVISILKKMRVEPDEFRMSVEATLTEEHPKVYDTITLIYEFKGDDLPFEKLEKAVNLSQERYCGVSAMLGAVADLKYEIRINS